MALVFDDFEVPTSIGTILFQDILRLDLQGGFAVQIDECREWGLEFTQIMTAWEGFYDCPDYDQEYRDYLKEKDTEIREGLGEPGKFSTKPTPDQWEKEVQKEREKILPIRTFPNVVFRLSIDSEFFGIWMQSDNQLIEIDENGILLLQTFPGPCMTNARDADLTSWHQIMGEVIVFFLKEVLLDIDIDGSLLQGRVVRAHLPDRVPAPEAMSSILGDVLDAGDVNYTTYDHPQGRRIEFMSLKPGKGNPSPKGLKMKDKK